MEGLVVQRDLAGFDTRDVKNIRQQPFKVLSGIAYDLNHVLVLRLKRRPQQHVGHGDHAVQRGADLMAHIGQKNAFGVIGGFRGDLRPGQFLAASYERLGPVLVVCDVQSDGDHAAIGEPAVFK